MPKARKKPIEIEYAQFTGDNWDEVRSFCGTRPASYNPDKRIENFGPADDWIVSHERTDDIVGAVHDYLHETWIGVKVGDYIIKGTKGEFYPHDGDLFWKNYDPVEDYNDHEPLE